MDTNVLVTTGTNLLRILDKEGLSPRAAMWVHNPEIDSWRLWVVPAKSMSDKRQFYRLVAEAISKHRTDLQGIDASDTELITDTHPAISALSKTFRVEGSSSIFISNNMLNGYYIPDGIILRMAI
jgi:hypothetical protein